MGQPGRDRDIAVVVNSSIYFFAKFLRFVLLINCIIIFFYKIVHRHRVK